MSKRQLLELVKEGYVSGWDDPRMPTICGLRRRGYTPEAIRDFCDRIGVAKIDSVVDIALLEHCLREDLNKRAPRVMARAAAAEGGDRQLPGRPGRGAGRGQQPRGPGARARARSRSRACSTSSRTTSARSRRRSIYRLAPGPGGAAALRLPRHAASAWSRTRRPARWSSCTAPTTRPPAAATRPTAAR